MSTLLSPCLWLLACSGQISDEPAGPVIILPGGDPAASPVSSGSSVIDLAPFEGLQDIVFCFDLPGLESAACMEEFVEIYAAQGIGPVDMLAELARAPELDERLEYGCHPVAHAIGRLIFKETGQVGASFDTCDETCHSGCYHGAVERVFFPDEAAAHRHPTYEEMQEIVPTLCTPDQFTEPTEKLIYQCLHGIGHALLFSVDFDLDLALSGCDLLPDSYQQNACAGGLFMENAVSDDKEARNLDPEDPLYPCNVVDVKYQRSCYGNQTSVMFGFGMTEDEIAETCLTAEPEVATCFRSLGRDLSNEARTGNIPRPVRACEELAGVYAVDCMRGVTHALIDNAWTAQFAFPFCNALSTDELRSQCYSDCHAHLKGYEYGTAEYTRDCQAYAGDQTELCTSLIPADPAP